MKKKKKKKRKIKKFLDTNELWIKLYRFFFLFSYSKEFFREGKLVDGSERKKFENQNFEKKIVNAYCILIKIYNKTRSLECVEVKKLNFNDFFAF